MIGENGAPTGSAGTAADDRPTSHRLRVGPWTVTVEFAQVADAEASHSLAAARLAEALVTRKFGLFAGDVRVASLEPTGRPVALVRGTPHPLSLSISHVPGLVGVAVCETAWVGLDIVDPAEAGRGLDVWFTPGELALVPDEDGGLRARLWAAKEAAYKACRIDTGFRPRLVTIDGMNDWGFSWTARHRHGDVLGPGRFESLGRHVVAVAATPAGRTPAALTDAVQTRSRAGTQVAVPDTHHPQEATPP